MSALGPGTARMTHPLTGADEIVRAEQVPHLERAGWRYEEGDRETWPEELQRFEGGAPGIWIRNLDTGGTAFVPELSGHLRERRWVEVGGDDDKQAQVSRLEDKTIAELREEAKARGVKVSGTKDELLARLSGSEATRLSGSEEAPEDAGEPAPSEEDEG